MKEIGSKHLKHFIASMRLFSRCLYLFSRTINSLSKIDKWNFKAFMYQNIHFPID